MKPVKLFLFQWMKKQSRIKKNWNSFMMMPYVRYGKTVQQYKQLKGLHKENLRDNMTNTELVLNQLAEISATELAKNSNPKGYSQAQDVTI